MGPQNTKNNKQKEKPSGAKTSESDPSITLLKGSGVAKYGKARYGHKANSHE